jgi:hypothetical protein
VGVGGPLVSKKSLGCKYHDNTIQSQSGVGSISPSAGRLRENMGQWRSTGANRYIFDGISNGYKMNLFTISRLVVHNNDKSALDNAESRNQKTTKKYFLRFALVNPSL